MIKELYSDGAFFANIVLREACVSWDLGPAREIVHHVLPNFQELQVDDSAEMKRLLDVILIETYVLRVEHRFLASKCADGTCSLVLLSGSD